MRSLVLVLPAEPVRATTGRAEPLDDVAGEGAEGRLDVVHDDRGHADGPGGQHGCGARLDGLRGEVVAVDALAGEGGEEAAWLHLPGVDDDRSGDLDAPDPVCRTCCPPTTAAISARERGITECHPCGLGVPRADGFAQHLAVVEGADHSGDVLALLVALARRPARCRRARRGRRRLRSRRPGPPRPATSPRSCAGTSAAPASMVARIARGSSERGLSEVSTAVSASRASAAPIGGALVRVAVAAAAEHGVHACPR